MTFFYPSHTRSTLFLTLICVSLVAAGDSGDEFSNNLFSDLAPLLTLFGEQVAKQFLGQSMGWADNLIFSMAPLGIITAVVAAIRVGGPTWLRAIIGRAKESQGVAELELMSSTSASVCELWNGQTVVRVLGSPDIIELVFLEKDPRVQDQNPSTDAPSVDVYSFEESKSCPSESSPLYRQKQKRRQKRKRRLISSDRGYSSGYELLGMSSPGMDRSTDVEDRIPNPCAPNISLNARGEAASQNELWSVAILGTIIQSVVIAYWGLITKYEPWLATGKFLKGGRPTPQYAFPMTTVGTVAVVMGMLICSHVVDAATVEEKWKAKEDEEGKVRFAWLQKGQVVNDEHFDSYAIFCLNDKQTIMTSRVKRDLKGFQSLVLLGTVVSISGFVAQFMGLRGMHWSATIAQLVATAVMSTLRAIIRRHLTRNPAAKKITKNFELDCMAREITKCERFSIPTGLLEGLKFAPLDPLLPIPDGPGKRLIETRERLRGISGWTSNFHKEISALCDAIERTMEYISDPSNQMTQVEKFQSVPELSNGAPSLIQRELDLAEFKWPLVVGVGGVGQDSETFEKIEFHLRRRKPREAGELWGKWKVDRSKLEAAYSLCMLDFHELEMRSLYQSKDRRGHSHRDHEDFESQDSTLRILGFGGTDISLPYARSLYDWWIARETKCIEVKNTTDGAKENDIPHFRVIGNILTPLEGSDGMLAVVTNTPLEKLCAQHIFSVFLSSASELISSMPGKMAVRRYNKRTIGTFGITHSSVDKIAQIVQEVGLASLEESYMTIIPPLAGKLPSITEAQRDILSIARRDGNLAIREELKDDMFFWLSYTCHITARSHTRTRKDLTSYMQAANAYFKAAEACVDILGKRDPRSRIAVRELLRAVKIVVFKAESLQFSLPENDLPELRAWYLNIHQWLQKSHSRMSQVTAPFNIAHLKIVELHQNVLGHWAISSDSNLGRQYFIAASTLQDWNMEQKLLKKTREYLETNVMANYDRKQWSEALSTALNKGLDAVTELLLESIPDAIALDVSMDYNSTELLSYSGPSTTLDGDKCLLGEFAMRSASYTFDVDSIDEKGQTALCRAAYSNHYNTAETLLETHGADIDKKDENGRSPIFAAAVLGHHNIFRLLYERGADINAHYEHGNTCLHAIASKDYLDLLDIVLDPGQDVRGIEIDSTNDFGETPLHFAAREGYLTMVNSLLDMGASADKANDIGQTPLTYAAASGHVAVINVLKERGASLNTVDKHGSSIIQTATLYGHTYTVAVLLDQGAPPQWECVQTAANLGNDGIVELVLSHLLLPEPLRLIMELPQQKLSKVFKTKEHAGFLQQPTRSSLLRTAIRRGWTLDRIKFFLDLDADPCHRDRESNSALSLAVEQGNRDLIFLLFANLSPIIISQDIRVPVRIAIEQGDEKTLDMLLQVGPVEDNDLIALSTRLGNDPITGKLFSLGLRLERQKVLELLRFSAVEGFAETFWLLRRLVPELLEIAKEEATLHLAAEMGKDNIVSALLSIGVNINSRSHGWTALHVAAKAGHLDTVKLLIQSGAWINFNNIYQWTALSLARARGFSEIEAYINSLDRTDPSLNWDNSNESPRSPSAEEDYDINDPWNNIFELDTGPYIIQDQQAELSFQLSGAVDVYPMQRFEMPLIDDTKSLYNNLKLIRPRAPINLADELLDVPNAPSLDSSDTALINVSSQTPPAV